MKNPTGEKKLGALSLCGLMIGPILGSGIIILPPLVYQVVGTWALFAWMLIIGVSFFFATIFARLSILFPGDAGVTSAIEDAFGSRVKKLASFYLLGAVLFGPVAVLLTAAKYLHPLCTLSIPLLSLPLLVFCTSLLLLQVTSIGKFSLIISTLVTVTLFSGSILILLFHRQINPVLPPFSGTEFAYGLLLLFWTVVGWEVVGNYSGDVHNPEKTIPRAVTFSVCIIAIVSLSVAAAVQFIDPSLVTTGAITITDLIRPLFAGAADFIMAFLVASLCITTYLLFTGGVARLSSSLANEGYLPKIFTRKSTTGAPVAAIVFMASIHLTVLIAIHFNLTTLEQLVTLANGFFIANALIGIMAAVKLLPGFIIKTAAVLLSIILVGLLFLAAKAVIVVIAIMAIFFLIIPGKTITQNDQT